MDAASTTTPPWPGPPPGLPALETTACRYRAGDVRPEDLPMIAAEALAAGLDTPALCELAGLPRHADSRDIREVFEQALAESGIELPAPGVAWRHELRRSAARLIEGDIAPAYLAGDGLWDGDGYEGAAAEGLSTVERAFVALIPPCDCCIEYTLDLDRGAWEAELRTAALALVASTPVVPGC
ncbi:hypothetical protein [Streptomyces sp. NBC_00102]|uniref:hypothetical protein n=1 Tax=Streptomyces sp. NBC_00102 TaxID=2975652 RepID=UPI002258408D|nr:hypothetical protein [Streptomyces sp. NBC_00102]MCX5397857.1 hypothetical protein [Streptomyces sp. NBC_00102]